ncbi:uncharacterized protein LOC141674171 [Apium graveolens]|uniref:uncharacterized protein LOC141674171 n=1 Tax=Apium graveolens TaxID=4045 RepID=UPI003D7B4257
MVDDLLMQRRSKVANQNHKFSDIQLQYFALAVQTNAGGLFFVYGSGGCGKTFVWKTLIYKLRSMGLIVLPVSSSGIAATLMPGGRTAHSRFKIPIVIDDCFSCAIAHDSDIASLIKHTSLIIWDEAPMQHRFSFECLDRSLRDIMKYVDKMRYNMPFGGITVDLGRDFHQILPVIPHGSRGNVVSSTITRSYLWPKAKILFLNRNMRLNQGNSEEEILALKKFAEWILQIGNGQVKAPIDSFEHCENDEVLIPSNFCDPEMKNSVENMIHWTYPNFSSNYKCLRYISERAILAPTNQVVGHLNSLIVETIPGAKNRYFSIDKAEDLVAQPKK